MATIIKIDGTEIDYSDFEIDIPLSPVGVSPTARVTTNTSESVSANDSVTIDIDGTTIFTGVTKSGGTKRQTGQVRVEAEHDIAQLMSETVTFSLAIPDVEQVLNEALDQADSGGSFSVSYDGSPPTLLNTYDADERTVRRVFNDMMDRTGRVFYIDPNGSTINVETPGASGLWQSIDTKSDSAVLQSFDSGSVETVRNAVTVNGTGGERVTGSASDSTSISNYGRRSQAYNVEYVTSSDEADEIASNLLITDPLAEGELLVGSNVGDVLATRVNQTVDVTDDAKNVSETGLVIEKQTIKQNHAVLQIGEGSGVSIEGVNRRTKSRSDQNEPGSIYNTDRIADDAISSAKVGDGEIDTTQISDDAISTPKVQANTITAAEVDTLALATNELTIGSDADEQLEFSTATANNTTYAQLKPTTDDFGALGTLTSQLRIIYARNANLGSATIQSGFAEFNVDGAANSLAVTEQNGVVQFRPTTDDDSFLGKDGAAFSEVWAYDYYDAATGSTINDGGDPLAGLATDTGMPDHCIACDDDGNELGVRINDLARSLYDICKAQQRRIEDQRDRLDALEARIADLEN